MRVIYKGSSFYSELFLIVAWLDKATVTNILVFFTAGSNVSGVIFQGGKGKYFNLFSLRFQQAFITPAVTLRLPSPG